MLPIVAGNGPNTSLASKKLIIMLIYLVHLSLLLYYQQGITPSPGNPDILIYLRAAQEAGEGSARIMKEML